MHEQKAVLYSICAWVLILAVVWLVTFQSVVEPVSLTIDAPWRNMINVYALSNIFGDKLTFTYGPLGFLFYPEAVGLNVLITKCFYIATGAIVLFALASLKQAIGRAQFLAAISGLLFALSVSTCQMGIIECTTSMTLVILLICPLVLGRIRSAICIVLSGLMSAVVLFLKFNQGVEGILLANAFALCCYLKASRRGLFLIALWWLSYLTAVSALSLRFFPTIGQFFNWLHISLEIASGYSLAMAVSGPIIRLVFGVTAVLAVLSSAFILGKGNRFLRSVVIAFVPGLFLAFKHGFVRQDLGHMLIGYNFMLVFAALLPVFVKRRRQLAIAAAIFVAIQTCELSCIASFTDAGGFDLIGSGLANFNTWFESDQLVRSKSAKNLTSLALPDSVVAPLRANKSSVECLPYNSLYCLGNQLKHAPNPICQLYSAYTPMLDNIASKYFEHGPDWVLVDQCQSIDGRHVFFESPRVWQTILGTYSAGPLANNIAFLKKQPDNSSQARSPLPLRKVGSAELVFGQWESIESAKAPPGCLLFLVPAFDLNWLGKCLNIVYQVPPVYLELKFDSGSRQKYRLVLANAADGLLANLVPESTSELLDLFKHTAGDRVAKYRFVCDAAALFQAVIKTDIYTSDYQVSYIYKSPWANKKISETGNPFSCRIEFEKLGNKFTLIDPAKVTVRNDQEVAFSGWVLDLYSNSPASKIFVQVDQEPPFPAMCGLKREDIAKLIDRRCLNSGVSFRFDAAEYKLGLHRVSFLVSPKGDRTAMFKIPDVLRINITK